jgi:FkbM family methyltransferase
MKLVSYAQNFEDIMLWRALKHIKEGFYIDVGAAWPRKDSVTKLFYDRGWRGINVEPNPEFARLLKEERPRDVNLEQAMGDHTGRRIINIVEDTGLTTLKEEIAREYEKNGYNIHKSETMMSTLNEAWEKNIESGQSVHFLKIDVEGYEKNVLLGNDWHRNRPWIVVVEATVPMSQRTCEEKWEAILISSSYQFAYADGLNRFYVAREREELIPSFQYPPNVFDQFITHSQNNAEEECLAAAARIKDAERALLEAEAKENEAKHIMKKEKENRINAEVRADEAQLSATAALESVNTLMVKLRTAKAGGELEWREAINLQTQLVQSRQALNHTRSELERTAEKLNAIQESTTWRLTGKTRRGIDRIKSLASERLKQRIKASLKQVTKLLKKVKSENILVINADDGKIKGTPPTAIGQARGPSSAEDIQRCYDSRSGGGQVSQLYRVLKAKIKSFQEVRGS